MNSLNLNQNLVKLTSQIIDIQSVSGAEKHLADSIETVLKKYSYLQTHRYGNVIVAKSNFGLQKRIILAGHLDTVPLPTKPNSKGTIPSQLENNILYGRGATDMKSGVAVQLALAHTLNKANVSANTEVTFVFYDNEEVCAKLNGLGKLFKNYPHLLQADFAVLLEPSNATIEAGCNGTLRAEISTQGVAAHSARSWVGKNAIHAMVQVLQILANYSAQTVDVDGLLYKEGLNAVRISGGVAGNVIPDFAKVEINYRFAPNKTTTEAIEHMQQLFADFCVKIVDISAGASPNLTNPYVAQFIKFVGREVYPKYGWTDVSRFVAENIPAINFGPGNPLLAHTDNENVSIAEIQTCYDTLETWLIDTKC